jgi:hypothetical protein
MPKPVRPGWVRLIKSDIKVGGNSAAMGQGFNEQNNKSAFVAMSKAGGGINRFWREQAA